MDSNASKRLKLQLLILRTQSGSESGFRELFNSFKGLTLKYLGSLLNELDTDDVQQQVWLKVYQQISTLSSPFGFKRWLLQITHRSAIDHLKKFKKYSKKNDTELVNSENFIEDEAARAIPKDFESLYIAIKKLSLDHREVILLFYWQDFTCIEIAQIMGCSTGTVKSRLFNARLQLQRTKSINNL
jgi:RNA polymerase sigma-70 factor (ECF subfamily)